MAWTSPATVVAGQLMTAAFWNTHVRDNELYLYGVSPFLLDVGPLADSAQAALTINGETDANALLLIITEASTVSGWTVAGVVMLRGDAHATIVVADAVSSPGSSFSSTVSTASHINVYWSVGNNRYEIENLTGTTLTSVKVFAFKP